MVETEQHMKQLPKEGLLRVITSGFLPFGPKALFLLTPKITKPSVYRVFYMAEKEGFEPSVGYKTYTPLAGERLQPLGHLSRMFFNCLEGGR